MNNCYTVYKHISPSNKVYIGITSRKPELRWRKGNGYYNNKHFYNAIKKYGWDNFKHEILFENLSKEEAERKEIELIDYYNSTNPLFGYNHDNGGYCSITATEETKRKISKGNKGKIVSRETRIKISKSTKGKRLGEHRSKEAREKIRQANLGKVLSEKQKKKIRENSGRNIKVCQYSLDGKLINIFDSQREAARRLNIDNSSITKCCKRKIKTAGGYVWKYLNKKEENIHND